MKSVFPLLTVIYFHHRTYRGREKLTKLTCVSLCGVCVWRPEPGIRCLPFIHCDSVSL